MNFHDWARTDRGENILVGISLVGWCLGVWKAIEIFMWLFGHVKISIHS